MTDRNLLLPAPPDAVMCGECRHVQWDHDNEGQGGAYCGLFGPFERLTEDDAYRLPVCLQAEQAAHSQAAELARLRRVEEAARSYVTTGTQSAWSNHALHRLRAALEER